MLISFLNRTIFFFRLDRLLLAIPCVLAFPALSQNPTPQSLAGDWVYQVQPNASLHLHLDVSATGELSGTVQTPGPPPKQIALQNVRLSGSILKYDFPGLGTVTEVYSPGDGRLIGAQVWQRANNSDITPQQAAGDWELHVRGTDGPLQAILHFRLNTQGALMGTMDYLAGSARRIPLQDIELHGRTLSFTPVSGSPVHEDFSPDGKMMVGQGGAWVRARDLQAALKAESEAKLEPTDGTWEGVIHNVTLSRLMAPTNNTLHLTFHFISDPAACTAESPELLPAGTPCQLTVKGNKVQVTIRLPPAIFDGTLSGDQLSGRWTVGDPWHWGPSDVTLTRTSPAQR